MSEPSPIRSTAARDAGIAAEIVATPQLMRLAHAHGSDAHEFWCMFFSGVFGAATAEVGFAGMRTILADINAALNKAEAGFPGDGFTH